MIDQLIDVHFSVFALLRVENPAPSRTRGFNRFPAKTKHKLTTSNGRNENGFCFMNIVGAFSGRIDSA